MSKPVDFLKERIDFFLQTQSFSETAKRESLSPTAIRNYILRAKTAKYVKNWKGQWLKGSAYKTEEMGSDWLEVHALTLVYPVKNPSKEWADHAETLFDGSDWYYDRHSPSRNYNSSVKQHYHHFGDWDGWVVRTTTKSIVLQMKEGHPLRGERAKELADRIYQLGMRKKKELESRFVRHSIKLGLQETTFKVSSQHWVHLETLIAKRFREEELRLNAEIDGELRTVVDFSDGVPHLEHVHKKHAPMDTQEWEKVVEDVNTGQYIDRKEQHKQLMLETADMKAMLKGAIQVSSSNAENHQAMAENMRTHIAAIQTLSQETKALGAAVRKLERTAASRKKRMPVQQGLGRWI